MSKLDPLEECTGFDWDDANTSRNWEKHRVAFWECEEVFFNRPLVRRDPGHSRTEPRYYALGETEAGRLLFVAFTIRRKLIRPISFRDMTTREGKHMPTTRKKIPKFSSEESERAFWSTSDSTDYVDWSKGRRAQLQNLKPSLRTISIRLPETMLAELKVLANKRDIAYQSLAKIFLAERIKTELTTESPKSRKH